jgi:N-acetylmuramoyl-L-alanine amidase
LIPSRALLRSVAVVRFRIWLTTALASGAIVGSLLHAQVDDEKSGQLDEFEQIAASPSPKPKKSPSPAAKASKGKSAKTRRATATPEKAPTAIPHAKLANEGSQKKTDASAKEKKSPTPIPKAKAAKEDSTTDDSESQEAQDSPSPRKANPATKSDERVETTRTPDPTASSKSRRRHTPTPKPKSKKSVKKEASRKKGGKSKSKEEDETPKTKKTPEPGAEERATASESQTPAPKESGVATPTPVPSPQSKAARSLSSGERAQVVIEKSGVEEDQGLEPPPSPPPRRGFWPWSRSSANYRYLTRSVIEAIRRAPVKRRRWQFIVVHNSGSRQGNARVFDYYHRRVRRMQNGLAYHFVIGNGTSTGNGQVEVGDRWRRQINGGHVHSDYLNNISLGICLVGDFNRDRPTRAQLDACDELIRYLRDRCGKTDRGTIPVRPHREMNPPRWPTDCPGDDFPYSWFRRF